MNIDQIGVILYTVRDFCTNEEDLLATLRKIRSIGYRAVQVSGVSSAIAPETIRRFLDETGLVCCATHDSGALIRQDPAAVGEKLKTLGSSIVAYPFPSDVDFDSEESVASLIRDLDQAGQVLSGRGMTLCYHNHAHELYRPAGAKLTILERIYSEIDPSRLASELDTFWIQAGGCDPVAWIEKMQGRIPILHVKDYAVLADGSRVFAEIGSGNLDWPAILSAAEKGGCRWFVVEQDSCPGDPFDSIAKSFEFLSPRCR
jgi:sugar phosphate isomerase/epimerase